MCDLVGGQEAADSPGSISGSGGFVCLAKLLEACLYWRRRVPRAGERASSQNLEGALDASTSNDGSSGGAAQVRIVEVGQSVALPRASRRSRRSCQASGRPIAEIRVPIASRSRTDTRSVPRTSFGEQLPRLCAQPSRGDLWARARFRGRRRVPWGPRARYHARWLRLRLCPTRRGRGKPAHGSHGVDQAGHACKLVCDAHGNSACPGAGRNQVTTTEDSAL